MDERFIVIDLGGTHVRVAVSDHTLRLRGKLDEPTALQGGPDGVLAQLFRMSMSCMADTGTAIGDVSLLTVGVPGPLDASTGVVFSPPNLPGWHDVPLRRNLEAVFQVPVKVVNDANAAALGEFHFGAGRGHRNFVYITVSTGIGGGIVVDGRLVEGTVGTAGEIGHTTIDRHGPVCPCGNIGCLEVIASGTAIARSFRERLAAGEDSSVTAQVRGRVPTAADVAAGAQQGDPLAAAVFEEAAEALGLGVVNCIHLFNPDVIAIGGGVSQAGDLLFGPVRRMVERHAFPVPRNIVRIVPVELGDEVGLFGAAAVAQAERVAVLAELALTRNLDVAALGGRPTVGAEPD
jgi:glucokinase